MTEIWKDIPGHEGRYQISSFGRVLSVPRLMSHYPGPYLSGPKILKPGGRNGYAFVGLHGNDKVKYVFIHRAVAIAFIPNPKGKRCINHKDCNPQNNNIDNLEWVTWAENNQHAWDNGRQEKMRQIMKNGLRKRKVIQFSLDGIEINRFDRTKDAAEYLGIGRAHISSCCKNGYGRKTTGGYKWEYATD